MQYDMHYYGTYAMAAAAGIPKADAEIIATSAQFVDDQNITSWVVAQSQEGFLGIATAHHPLDAGIRVFYGNAEINDTRLVWIPFHFMPGGIGNTFEEKLICRNDSKVVNKVLDHYLSPSVLSSHGTHALQLLGIAAHVYADSFSHCGFSGINSRLNRIANNSLEISPLKSDSIKEYLKEAKDRFFSQFSETSALGHGAVLTYPDQPYLKWEFSYEDGSKVYRNNPDLFLAACKALHARFKQFAKRHYKDPPPVVMEWKQLESPVRAILEKESPADERVKHWIESMTHGPLRAIPACKPYDDKEWLDAISSFKTSLNAEHFNESPAYNFFVAADYHRNFVLKRLLPSHGIGLLVA